MNLYVVVLTANRSNGENLSSTLVLVADTEAEAKGCMLDSLAFSLSSLSNIQIKALRVSDELLREVAKSRGWIK